MIGRARGLGGRLLGLVKMVRNKMKETNHTKKNTRYSRKLAIII